MDQITVTDAELDELESKLKTDPAFEYQLLSRDREEVVPLILEAQKRRPQEVVWYMVVGSLAAQDQFEARALPAEQRRAHYGRALGYLRQTLENLSNAETDKNKDLRSVRKLLEEYIATAMVEAGELEAAKRLAEERLKNNVDPNSWNYGNVIHESNTVLGRVALRQNDLKAAKDYLLKSGKTPGSPQLNSFGPSFVLARELLEKGETEAVLEYLELVAAFWANPKEGEDSDGPRARSVREHADQLKQWREEIAEGNIPQDRKWR